MNAEMWNALIEESIDEFTKEPRNFCRRNLVVSVLIRPTGKRQPIGSDTEWRAAS
jgi:hypothetical protein